MNLTVLTVAFPFAPVRPDVVGGAEQVVRHIDAALVRAGHRSVVLARADSCVQGRLLPVDTAGDRDTVLAELRERIAHAIRRFEADVVHMHGVDFHAYLPPAGRVPILVTLHLPPSWYPPEVFAHSRSDVFLHCVSRTQHQACPAGAQLLPPIENGVAVRARRARVQRQGFVFAMGRICPEKNWHAALDAAAMAGVPMVLAGQVFPYPAHERYFEAEIRPRLDDRRRFVGALGPRAKHRLLSRARCMLVSSLAPETSSLVAMEALACGTPVVAYRSGALPEIVEDGVTGFLVDSPQEMADAIRRCDRLDADRCHEVARERFDARRMTAEYLDVYRALAQAGVR